MAKSTKGDLPYFKFQISAWNGGDILQCNMTAQGLFINLCALYWGKRGELYFSKMLKKFPRKQKHFDELISEGVIKLIEDKIVISFLDEQLSDRGAVSVKNADNAKERWNKNKSDAVASASHNGRTTVAPHLEKSREEEKRKEQNIRAREELEIDSRETFVEQKSPKPLSEDEFEPLTEAWFDSIFDEIYLEQKAMTFKEHNIRDQLIKFKSKVIGAPADYIYRDTDGIRKAFDYQLRNTKPDRQNGNSTSKNQRNTSSLIAGFAARHGPDAAE